MTTGNSGPNSTVYIDMKPIANSTNYAAITTSTMTETPASNQRLRTEQLNGVPGAWAIDYESIELEKEIGRGGIAKLRKY